jgi:REP element-mobilizing transposase RayT
MARQRRLKSHHPDAIYHCVTRTVNGEMLFDDSAKETLRKQLHQAADFSGVQIITYAIMTNHFHVFVRVPEQKDVSDKELVRRYKVLHPTPSPWATLTIEVLENLLKENGSVARNVRDKLLRRMGNISEFMKTVKQRFSIWFNQNHKRFGTLWAERFTSTIVEGNRHFAMRTVAAYIDLNPVRAGLVKDPKDYRWCGYGEAEATGGKMIEGLRSTMAEGDEFDDATVLAEYRMKLFGKGSAPKHGDSSSASIHADEVEKVLEAGGKLSVEQRLRLRMRWLTKGAIIGGHQFVNEHLHEYQTRTAKRRGMKVRPFATHAADDFNEMFSMRGGQDN